MQSSSSEGESTIEDDSTIASNDSVNIMVGTRKRKVENPPQEETQRNARRRGGGTQDAPSPRRLTRRSEQAAASANDEESKTEEGTRRSLRSQPKGSSPRGDEATKTRAEHKKPGISPSQSTVRNKEVPSVEDNTTTSTTPDHAGPAETKQMPQGTDADMSEPNHKEYKEDDGVSDPTEPNSAAEKDDHARTKPADANNKEDSEEMGQNKKEDTASSGITGERELGTERPAQAQRKEAPVPTEKDPMNTALQTATSESEMKQAEQEESNQHADATPGSIEKPDCAIASVAYNDDRTEQTNSIEKTTPPDESSTQKQAIDIDEAIRGFMSPSKHQTDPSTSETRHQKDAHDIPMEEDELEFDGKFDPFQFGCKLRSKSCYRTRPIMCNTHSITKAVLFALMYTTIRP